MLFCSRSTVRCELHAVRLELEKDLSYLPAQVGIARQHIETHVCWKASKRKGKRVADHVKCNSILRDGLILRNARGPGYHVQIYVFPLGESGREVHDPACRMRMRLGTPRDPELRPQESGR